jgi:hypothetical protein
MSQLEALGLARWPFSPAPSLAEPVIWAGRPELRAQVERLTKTWELDNSNALYLIWATWGMGKTHFLYFLRQEMVRTAHLVVIPVYCELPDGPFRFIDVYRQAIQGLPLEDRLDSLAEMLGAKVKSLGMPGIGRRLDVEKALWYLATDAGGKGQIAARWLQAAVGTSQRELNSLGISSPLKTAGDAALTLVALMNLIVESAGPNARLLLLFDEYQRVGAQPPSRSGEVHEALLTVFNRVSQGLKIATSFRSGDYDNVRVLLSPSLMSRASIERFSIDKLDEREARAFLADLLSQVRPKGRWGTFYPFTRECVDKAIAELNSSGIITPRIILQCFGHVLSVASAERDVSQSDPISASESSVIMSSPVCRALQSEDED